MSTAFIDREQARYKQRREKAARAREAARRRDKEHAASLRQVKEIVEYDASVPRCANCLHFQVPAQLVRIKAYDVRIAGTCRQHGFPCVAVGVCNSWQHPLGDTLES